MFRFQTCLRDYRSPFVITGAMVLLFVAFLRFVLFMAVDVGLPAFVIGAITNGLLSACTRLAVRSRLLVSGAVGLGLFYAIAAVTSGQSGFLITSGFVLVTAALFIVIDICAARLVLPYRIVLACVLSVVILWSIQVGSLDGFEGEVCSATLSDHTWYAPTYSAAGFRRIQVGMTAEQVQQLLGKPLDEWTPDSSGQVYWRWTRSRDKSHFYRYRVVTFLGARVDGKSAYSYCNPMD